jgi:hypothetical protein
MRPPSDDLCVFEQYIFPLDVKPFLMSGLHIVPRVPLFEAESAIQDGSSDVEEDSIHLYAPGQRRIIGVTEDVPQQVRVDERRGRERGSLKGRSVEYLPSLCDGAMGVGSRSCWWTYPDIWERIGFLALGHGAGHGERSSRVGQSRRRDDLSTEIRMMAPGEDGGGRTDRAAQQSRWRDVVSEAESCWRVKHCDPK